MRVRSLNCPKCGGRTRLEHGQQEAQCIHCGEPVRLSHAVLQEQQNARKYPNNTPLQLGMKAEFEGRKYELTGRQVMRQVDTDGVYLWEEFVLIAPDGDLLYLEFDEGKWKCSRPFTPDTPLGPDQLRHFSEGSLVPMEKQGAMVSAKGRYHVAHAEGEFPFVVVPNREVTYLDAAHLTRFYSVEWTEDSVEYYRGRFLEQRMVYTMFDLRDKLQELDSRERVLASRRRFGGVCLTTSILVLILWAYSFSSGHRAPNAVGSVDLSRVGTEGVRFGPIPLKAVDRVHRLEIHGSMRETSFWVQAILEDENKQELFAAQRDMWDESGHDSDGYWHESSLHGSTYFVLKKPGNYYVRMYSERDGAVGRSGSARFELKQEALYPTYLGVFGFTALILGFGFLLAGSPSTVQSIKESASSDD